MHLRTIIEHFIDKLAHLRLRHIGAFCLGHIAVSYIALTAMGEKGLTSDPLFYLYYWVVTSSTVGYGDASPVTEAGQTFVALFFIPFSLALFAMLMGNLGQRIANHTRRFFTGMKNFNQREGHILIMGYQPGRTQEIVTLILGDSSRLTRDIIVVCNDPDVEHPFADIKGVEFARVVSLTAQAELERVALFTADKIIVDGKEDNESFMLASHYASLTTRAHITTHIRELNVASNLHKVWPNVEVVVDNTEELMVRSMQDNGSSQVVTQLLRADVGQTIFTTPVTLPTAPDLERLVQHMRLHHQAIFLGLGYDRTGSDLVLNPDKLPPPQADAPLHIHYIAKTRLCEEALKQALQE
jgi:voltage-gated potassium channel